MDKEGKDILEQPREKYGDVLVRAYLDEEYFEHLHGGNAEESVGRLSVDVMGADGLSTPVTTHCVVKCGPYWTRLPNVENSQNPRWNQRLRYPVFDPGERVTVALFEGTASDAKYLGRVKLQLSTMEDGVRYASNFQLMTRDPSGGAVTKTHVARRFAVRLRIGRLESKPAKYMRPSLPEKWYLQPLADDERDRVIKSQKEMLVKRLAVASPPVSESASKILLEFAKHEVNIGSIKSSVARIQRVVAGFDKIGAAMTYALSWDSVIITAATQCWIVYLVYYPNMFAPTVLLATATVVARAVPGPVPARVGSRAGGRVAQPGRAFPPPTEEEERAKKEREDAARAEEEAAAAAKEEEAKALAALCGGARREGDAERSLAEKKRERVAEKTAAEKAKGGGAEEPSAGTRSTRWRRYRSKWTRCSR